MTSLQSVLWFVVVMETWRVLCDLRNEFLSIIYYNFVQPDFIMGKNLVFSWSCCMWTNRAFISLCFQVSDVALSKTLTVYRVPVSEEAVLSFYYCCTGVLLRLFLLSQLMHTFTHFKNTNSHYYLKHWKTLKKLAPTCFGPYLRPSSGGSCAPWRWS